MSISHQQLDQFHSFASAQLASAGNDLTWPQLFDLWRLEHPPADAEAAVYAALDESLEDIEQGRHRPADEVLRGLRAKHRLSE